MADDITTASPTSAVPEGRQPGAIRLPVGTVVNARYLVEEVLGEGGMGVVYGVHDELHPERAVALKTVNAQAIRSEQLARFQAEFRTMARLSHPHVARVYDFEAVRGARGHCFTMERIVGRDIRTATQASTGWAEVLPLLVQVCRALAYLHSRQVVHCDIKPSNIFVDTTGSVKVLDFGIASLAGLMSERSGTLHYMAPELFGEGCAIDHRIDLYALGITFYELLCRRRPFDGETLASILAQHQHAPLPFDEHERAALPPWLIATIEKLCAKNPADRFHSANLVIENINRAATLGYELETQETRQSYTLSSRFVGRQDELEQILERLRQRDEGNGGPPLLLVGGPSGIGKSRLLREVRQQQQLRGVAFLEGNCHEGALTEHGAWLDLFRQLRRLLLAVDQRALITRFDAHIARLDPAATNVERAKAPVSLEDAEMEREVLLSGLVEFCLDASDRLPFVAYINDLQWASHTALALLKRLAEAIRRREQTGAPVRMALIGSFRDNEVSEALQPLVDRADAEGSSLVRLAALQHDDTHVLLCSMLGVDHLPGAFVARVLSETAGNPFFVQEVMRSLLENGSVYLEHGQWRATAEVGELDIPSSVAAAFRRRVSVLQPAHRHLLELIAVSDQPVHSAVLRHAFAEDGERVPSLLEDLRRLQMAGEVHRGAGIYRLDHDRMRETLDGDLDEGTRQRLHHDLALALEAGHGGDPAGHVYEIAEHYWQSGLDGPALDYSVRAADHARASYAYDLAAKLLQRVRDLLERRGHLGSPEELAASEGLGEAHWLAGSAPKARTVLSELAARCRDRGVLERLQRKIGETHFHEGTFGEATESYWRAVAALGEWRPRSSLGMGLLGLRELGRYLALCLVPGRWRHPRRSEPTKADGLSATYFRLAQCYFWSRPALYVVPMLRSINLGWRSTALEDRALAYSLSAIFWSSTLKRRARRDVARTVALANRIAPSKIGGVMRVCTAIALWQTGAWPEAEKESLEARRIYQKIGAITELGTASIMRWVCLGGRGLMREALECAESALPGLRSSSASQFIKVTHYMRARALAKLGETEAALEEGHIAVELGEKTQDQLATAMALIELGDAYLTAGRLTEADEWLTRACASPLPLFMLFDWTCRAFPLLARARFEAWQQDVASRERHRECARALRTAVLVSWLRPNQRPDVWTVRGSWRWQHGRKRAAERDFARAIARAQGFTSLIQEADAYYAWGRCTLASSPERARERLQKAREVYATCGVVAYERRTAVLLDSVAN